MSQSEGSAAQAVPQWAWWLTGAVAALALAGLIVSAYSTRSGIIARATTKEAVRQPVFYLSLVLVAIFLLVLAILPYFSLGEDFKMLKYCGLATLLFVGLLLGVWTSSTSISAEIEGKTAMTLLSKPINRRQFILGKYLGILQSILILLIPLAVGFLALVYFRVDYDYRESAKGDAEHAVQWEIMMQTVPLLLLVFLEVAVLTAVSVALSTRVPMIINLVSCFAIFVVGHLAPILVRQAVGGLEFVQVFAQLIATLLPSLQVFDAQATIATGSLVPPVYLGLAAVYSTAYAAAAILLAFLLFEDRDLA